MMKDVLGLNFKLITGYPTGNHNNLAMERGEIHGWAASWENLIGTRPHWITEKKVTLLAQFLLERKPQIPEVPTLLELAPADKKDVVEFLSASTPFGRGVVVGPGVPADRVAALRDGVRGDHEGPGLPRGGAEAAGRYRLARPRAHHVAGQEDGRRVARPGRAGEEVDRTGRLRTSVDPEGGPDDRADGVGDAALGR